jgi:cyclophilin family peptidyl-prolyl cis-trans isomerase
VLTIQQTPYSLRLAISDHIDPIVSLLLEHFSLLFQTMVLVKRQQSCPPSYFGGYQLPMGDDDASSSSSGDSYNQYSSDYPEVRKPSSPSSLEKLTNPLSKWILPLTYGLVVLSWFSAFRFNDSLTQISVGLHFEQEALAFQKGESLRILSDAKEAKDAILRQHKKLKRTQKLFDHEIRMKEELFEMKMSSENKETLKTIQGRQSGIAMTWIQQRQETLYRKIYMLQDYIQEKSRQQVIAKYGAGPHRVEFQVASYHNKKPGQFVVELASLDFVPHAVETFLDMISSGLWDNTVFYHHNSQHHVVAAAPVNYGTFEPKHYHFEALGYTGVGFPEYSEFFPHEKYTLGFSGKGPNFYINTMDNGQHHGPGGQGHHDLPTDADPCFGKIISGFEAIKKMNPGTHSSEAEPLNWQDFDLTRIVKIRLIED